MPTWCECSLPVRSGASRPAWLRWGLLVTSLFALAWLGWLTGAPAGTFAPRPGLSPRDRLRPCRRVLGCAPRAAPRHEPCRAGDATRRAARLCRGSVAGRLRRPSPVRDALGHPAGPSERRRGRRSSSSTSRTSTSPSPVPRETPARFARSGPCSPSVAGAVRSVDAAPSFVDEVLQRLRTRVLVPEDGRSPRILDYAGRGSLENWLRAGALRLALNARRDARRGPEPLPDASLWEPAAPTVDRTLELLRGQVRRRLRRRAARGVRARWRPASGTCSGCTSSRA